MDLKAEILQLLGQIPTCGSSSEQVALFQQVQEIALHRDMSGNHDLIHTALPYALTLLHQHNASLVSAILLFISEATRRSPYSLEACYDAATSLLMLSYSTEKNVLQSIQNATMSLLDAFQFVNNWTTNEKDIDSSRTLWKAVLTSIMHAVDIVMSTPLPSMDNASNNRNASIFLRAWKYVERAVLLFSFAKDSTVYRDPARSNIQPDSVTIDSVTSHEHMVLNVQELESLGTKLVKSLCERLINIPNGGLSLSRRELCVGINSLSMITAMRPQMIPHIIPCLLVCSTESFIGASDKVVQATLKANLVKILSHPAAQPIAEEITECLIALGDSERAFKAISKSKVPRRKYVSAPSEASLRRARIGKRTAEKISDSQNIQQTTPIKRARDEIASTQERVTHNGLANMASATLVNLVLEGFASDWSSLPSPPSDVKLHLPPSELKPRIGAILARLATPSSVLALDNNVRRGRDPRRQKDNKDNFNLSATALVPIFDEYTLEETSDWIAKNASTVEEPLVSVGDDNSVQVFLKPMPTVWYREMATDALYRILENEYGVTIKGDQALRESILCRLASSPWFLLTDEENNSIQPSNKMKLPRIYQVILDFTLENITSRVSLAIALLYHEYLRTISDESTTDVIYRRIIEYYLKGLVEKLDLTSASGKKLFGLIIGQLPLVTIEVFCVLNILLKDKMKSVLAITVLRDLTKERKECESPALRLLLRYTCFEDDSTRNTSIRCVANQLYVMDHLKLMIESYAIMLVESLKDKCQAAEDSVLMVSTRDIVEVYNPNENQGSEWFRSQFNEVQVRIANSAKERNSEITLYASELERDAKLTNTQDTETDTLRRLELYIALCAKKPSLLPHMVTVYGLASPTVRQVMVSAVEKLFKHFKQRGNVSVVDQLHGFSSNALDLVCHIIHILASTNPSVDIDSQLVQRSLELWRAHEAVSNSILVLIPVLSNIPREVFFSLLPTLLSLPQSRWEAALKRILEAIPPQLVTPIDLLIALHHVDLKLEPTLQKKVVGAIDFCLKHSHAFPSDVLVHVCRVLLTEEEIISKLALRTLITSVTTYPALKNDAAQLLVILVERKVWEMEEVLWKGFVKCAALIQPASFHLLLEVLPAKQLECVLIDERALSQLLLGFITSPNAPATLNISLEVRDLVIKYGSATM